LGHAVTLQKEIMNRNNAESTEAAGATSRPPSKSNAPKTDDARNEKNILAFKVSHILVSILLLWLLCVFLSPGACDRLLTLLEPFRFSVFSFSPKAFS
jgi:hypothetical protein